MSKTDKEIEQLAEEWIEDVNGFTIVDANGQPSITPQSAFVAGYLQSQKDCVSWAMKAWDDGYNAGRAYIEGSFEIKEDA